MRIVFVTSEMAPFAKTGGLADVCGSLPFELSQLGHTVKVILPFYKMIKDKNLKLEHKCENFTIPLGHDSYKVRVLSYQARHDVEVLFVDVPKFFDREDLYGTAEGDYPDSPERFSLFQKSCFVLLKKIDFAPDILHCHDWQTGLIPVYTKVLYKDVAFFQDTKTVFTIHNLAYQGLFNVETLPVTGLSWDFFTIDKLEFFGKISYMKGALVYADVITTVSQRYSEEIQTEEYGCGLEGVLQKRKDDLCGILNGIDNAEWNPETDKDLNINYKPGDFNRKIANKGILQKENGLEVDPNIPLIGIITRLADQKGLDILAPIMEKLAKKDLQFVLLGTGTAKYNDLFKKMGKKYSGKFGINILFDPKMSKRIYAGADIFLMPSHYEPCGLGQLIALRYGTVPLVRATGGLADTITDFNPASGVGNGFVFSDYTSEALLSTIDRTINVFKDKKLWRKVIENGAKSDFSWKVSARKYIDLYRNTVQKKGFA
ncbi:MAG: glycogen synthase GlgA [Candidatus Omnitrophica bacterium]|nr:glycogen synthase GlgA [Candidatus Omnitrophota bacterium]